MAPDLLSRIRSEIDERLNELRPLLAEHERLIDAAEALQTAGAVLDPADERARTNWGVSQTLRASDTASPARATRPAKDRKPARGARGAARSVERETIVAALEHGSHTVAELTVVTAMSAPNINGSLRKLVSEGAVVKIEREGKAAWALAAAA
jgi:hypothetical protein